jgi:hypothetical protein
LDKEGTAPARPEKAARLERPAVEGPTGAEEVAAESADPPGGCGLGAAWEAQLVRLAAYKEAHGECNVPKRWAEDPRLGTWVNNQRQLKRKLDRGEPSEGMTAERAARLEALGFAWATQLRAAPLEPEPAEPEPKPKPEPEPVTVTVPPLEPICQVLAPWPPPPRPRRLLRVSRGIQ